MGAKRLSMGMLTLAVLLATIAPACGSAEPGLCDEGNVSGPTRGYVVNRMLAPSATESYAYDLDNDEARTPDNQMQVFFGALQSLGVGVQLSLDIGVRRGDNLILLEVQSADLRDSCARVTLSQGLGGSGAPAFDGRDTLTRDPAVPPLTVYGQLRLGRFDSPHPSTLPGPVQRSSLRLPQRMLGSYFPLPLHGVHLRASALSETELLGGEIHGVIPVTERDRELIPALAILVTGTIRAMPMGTDAETFVRVFEDPSRSATSARKCSETPERCCKQLANRPFCEITADEVRENPLVGLFLRPDVQIFQDGRYAPVPGGPAPDALSAGFGFTAVAARIR